jgi:hypothetical protein
MPPCQSGGGNKSLRALCLDTHTGKVLWIRNAFSGYHGRTHDGVNAGLTPRAEEKALFISDFLEQEQWRVILEARSSEKNFTEIMRPFLATTTHPWCRLTYTSVFGRRFELWR